MIISINSCTEKFSLDEQIDKDRIVIEGVVNSDSIPGAFNKFVVENIATFVRITRVNPALSSENNFQNYNKAIYVDSALVIVYDDFGNIDTLSGFDNDNHNGDNGYYYSRDFIGKPGRTYYLKVLFENKEYTAEAYMPPVLNIDSMYIPPVFFNDKDPETVNEGIRLFFKDDSSRKDFYMFEIKGYQMMTNLLDDRFLSPTVEEEGFILGDGDNPRYWLDNYSMLDWGLSNGGKITIKVSSLTEDRFKYHQDLLNQFYNDGGILSPTPASPKGNISNGALGEFRASGRSYIIGGR